MDGGTSLGIQNWSSHWIILSMSRRWQNETSTVCRNRELTRFWRAAVQTKSTRWKSYFLVPIRNNHKLKQSPWSTQPEIFCKHSNFWSSTIRFEPVQNSDAHTPMLLFAHYMFCDDFIQHVFCSPLRHCFWRLKICQTYVKANQWKLPFLPFYCTYPGFVKSSKALVRKRTGL